ncbi:hypothetical protein EST38_g11291 [Candolleomyces aberdarensis]|uniref:Cyclin N-terminal domain-containing protein n=1 Tax=Candolleomyces aberdarensis TaxID=2316362 RepID=A0A4Q2D6R3_9AGAR|nr:hypothetical protein EST38_g11291 [Candolleomyces aberdarensis]
MTSSAPITTRQPRPEVYIISKEESIALSEMVFAYLACTVGPNCSRAVHRWIPKYRELLSGVLRNAYLHPHVSAAAMHYIRRLKRRQPSLEISGRAGLNMFIAALMVADKVIHDHRITRSSWLHIVGGRLDMKQLLRLEVKFLEAIGWNLTLSQKVFDDFDEIAAGWMALRQYAPEPDFFARRKWDGLRAPAFDFFDGILNNVDESEMYVPPIRSELEHERWIQGVPVVYDLADSFWEEVPLNDAPFIIDLTDTSSLTSSPTLVSEQKKHLPSPPWLKTPQLTPIVSSRPIHVSHSQSDDSDVTYDDLSPVDWTESEPTEEERKLLGFNRPRFLLAFAVATLSLPSMYEKGENSETRIRKWLSRCEPQDYTESLDSTEEVEESLGEILDIFDLSSG